MMEKGIIGGAVRGGHPKMVASMISNGVKNSNEAMREVVLRGHLEIVKLMWHKGATDFNGGMINAIRGNHSEIVEWMIRKGANNDGNRGMREASVNRGFQRWIEFMISKAARDLKIMNTYNDWKRNRNHFFFLINPLLLRIKNDDHETNQYWIKNVFCYKMKIFIL